VTKIADLVGNPDALGEFLGAIARRRLVRTYGTFYRIIKLDDEENPGEECPDCGSLVIVDLGCASHVTLDSKGVWRLHRSREDVDRAMAGAVSLHWVPSGDPEKSHEIKGAIDLFLEPSVAASVARDKWNRYLASEW
jgi:hypothetical protein